MIEALKVLQDLLERGRQRGIHATVREGYLRIAEWLEA